MTELLPYRGLAYAMTELLPYRGLAYAMTEPLPYRALAYAMTEPLPYRGLAYAMTELLRYRGHAYAMTEPLPYRGLANAMTELLPYRGHAYAMTEPLPYRGLAYAMTEPLPYRGHAYAMTELLPYRGHAYALAGRMPLPCLCPGHAYAPGVFRSFFWLLPLPCIEGHCSIIWPGLADRLPTFGPPCPCHDPMPGTLAWHPSCWTTPSSRCFKKVGLIPSSRYQFLDEKYCFFILNNSFITTPFGDIYSLLESLRNIET